MMAPTVLQLGRRFFAYVVGAVVALGTLLDGFVAIVDGRKSEVAIRMVGACLLFAVAVLNRPAAAPILFDAFARTGKQLGQLTTILPFMPLWIVQR